jgi:hypothetical protein
MLSHELPETGIAQNGASKGRERQGSIRRADAAQGEPENREKRVCILWMSGDSVGDGSRSAPLRETARVHGEQRARPDMDERRRQGLVVP